MPEASQWSPRADDNPYRVWSMKNTEEWREVARWYPFSIRVLVTTTGEAEWHEQAICGTWDQACEIMQLLGKANQGKAHLPGWVVMKCSLVGKEGREKAILWYPSESSVLTAMRTVTKRNT